MTDVQVAAKKMPGPEGSMRAGMAAFVADPLAYFCNLADTHGDYVKLKLIRGEGVLVVDPEGIEDVLVRKKKHFIKGRGTRSLRSLLGNGLLVSEGEFWRRQRRLAQPAFHKDRIARYAERMVSLGNRMLDRWQPGQQMDIHEQMAGVTLSIVADALFSADVSQSAGAVGAGLAATLQHFQWWSRTGFLVPLWVPVQPNRMFLAARRRLDAVVNAMISERRQSGQRCDDLLDVLLNARDEDGSAMSLKQVRDEVMTLLLAGHETTANSLTWTFYLLGQHPEIEAKLAQEVATVLQGRPATVADLPALKYTEMVVKESMRLYPPVWVLAYDAIADVQVGPYTVRKGAAVFMSQWVNHHDARWFSEPLAFQPERWADPKMKSLPTYAYFPFGGGERLCIGKSFALMEAQLLLATIVQRYHLELVKDQKVTLAPSVTLRPGNGVQVVVHKRATL